LTALRRLDHLRDLQGGFGLMPGQGTASLPTVVGAADRLGLSRHCDTNKSPSQIDVLAR
jgi:hypothetical protein